MQIFLTRRKFSADRWHMWSIDERFFENIFLPEFPSKMKTMGVKNQPLM